jgi:Cdc6-like AAA superfamily ATPase
LCHTLRDVYERYTGLCKELYMRPVHTSEFLHTCVLLQEQALLNLVSQGSAEATRLHDFSKDSSCPDTQRLLGARTPIGGVP